MGQFLIDTCVLVLTIVFTALSTGGAIWCLKALWVNRPQQPGDGC